MTTIVSAQSLASTAKFNLASQGKLERRGGPGSLYFTVPPEAQALSIDSLGGSVATTDPLGFFSNIFSSSRLMGFPPPGTWSSEVRPLLGDDALLDTAWRTEPGRVSRTPYNLGVTLLGATITAPLSLNLDYGSAQTVEVGVANKFGAFTGGFVDTAIGAGRTLNLQLKAREQKVMDIQVPEGCPLLLADLSGISPSNSEVDMYLFDCTGERCRPVSAVLNQGTPPQLRQLNPKPASIESQTRSLATRD